MCGFCVYLVIEILVVVVQNLLGVWMDFDIEVMVKLYWQGIESCFLLIKVIYFENGILYFDVLYDNLCIFWMYICLFFGMLLCIFILFKCYL